MSKSDGQNKALIIAKNKLCDIDLHKRLKLLGFNGFQNKIMKLKLFDNLAVLHEEDLSLRKEGSGENLRIDDTILFFHYLLFDGVSYQSDQFISFRDLPGGRFYWDTFLDRSVVPLVRRTGNDLGLLKKNLSRFDWEPMICQDFGAKIHTIGNADVLLTYQLGDDEFPPTANILFAELVRHVYSTEDVAVMASRICYGLYQV